MKNKTSTCICSIYPRSIQLYSAEEIKQTTINLHCST